MHIVLLILKIIGAILGGLIGLVLSLVLLVLFVPVRYQVNVISADGVCAKVRVHWLLHILHLSVVYEEKKTKLKLRIFGIPFKQNKKKKERKTGKKDRKLKKKTADKESKKVQTSIKEDKKVKRIEKVSDKKIGKKVDKSQKQKVKESSVDEQKILVDNPKEDNQDFDKKKIHPIKKIKEISTHIKQAICSIPQKLSSIKDSIRKFLRKKEQIIEFIRAEGTKYTLRKGKDALIELIRYIIPRNLRGYIRFGTGDPCQTGQILAGASIFYVYFNPKFSLYPDFEEKKLEADLEAKGRMRMIRFVRIAARFYFDKQIKQCIADFKQLKEE